MKPDRIKEIEKLAELISSPIGAHIKQTQQWCIEAASALRELLEERKWKPIDSAPKDGTPILLWEDDQAFTGRFLAEVRRPGWYSDCNDPEWDYPSPDSPTHWLPLPSPPEEGEGR